MPLHTDHPDTRRPDHVVQFYERVHDLIDNVVPFLATGLHNGEAVVIVATRPQRQLFLAGLRNAGVDLAAARAQGQLLVLDAGRMMAQFVHDGDPDPDDFDRVIGGLVREASAGGRRIRAFGEMVALLWERGLVPAAIELEELWSGLGREIDFSLYCAYPSYVLAQHGSETAIGNVCAMHSALVDACPDVLNRSGDRAPNLEAWRMFPRDVHAPRMARRFVMAALEQWERTELIDDAALIVTELATNAITHAGSNLTLSLRCLGSRVIVTAYDTSSALPCVQMPDMETPSGRGLQLIAALSATWGALPVSDGKVVWAELIP